MKELLIGLGVGLVVGVLAAVCLWVCVCGRVVLKHHGILITEISSHCHQVSNLICSITVETVKLNTE